MPDPRLFLVRHGETAWSLSGQHTGTTELELTGDGERRIDATGRALVGADRLIVPAQLAHIYVSPRRRAQRTLQLLGLGCHAPPPWSTDPEGNATATAACGDGAGSEGGEDAAHYQPHVQVTDRVAEWDYGDYEGLTSKTIRELRKEKGQGEAWDIWRDGCPGGESPQQITERLDAFIADVRTRFHGPAFESAAQQQQQQQQQRKDVLVVAHGHILRALAMRWIGHGLDSGVSLILEAGGVGTLSYEHHNIHEPAIL